ncbi:MAG: hypothetical protein J6K45_07140 [Clostridia bacterium]|nr:hypothetical protein [Clostridia bacterium]
MSELSDDFVAVRKVNYLPRGNKIQTTRNAGLVTTLNGSLIPELCGVQSIEHRNTVHFAINQLVSDNDGGSWRDCKYAFLIPLNKIDNVISNDLEDTYTFGDVCIPEGSKILIPKSDMKMLTKEEIESGLYVEYKGTLKEAFIHQMDLMNKVVMDPVFDSNLKNIYFASKGKGYLHSWTYLEYFEELYLYRDAVLNQRRNTIIDSRYDDLSIDVEECHDLLMMINKLGYFTYGGNMVYPHIDLMNDDEKGALNLYLLGIDKNENGKWCIRSDETLYAHFNAVSKNIDSLEFTQEDRNKYTHLYEEYKKEKLQGKKFEYIISGTWEEKINDIKKFLGLKKIPESFDEQIEMLEQVNEQRRTTPISECEDDIFEKIIKSKLVSKSSKFWSKANLHVNPSAQYLYIHVIEDIDTILKNRRMLERIGLSVEDDYDELSKEYNVSFEYLKSEGVERSVTITYPQLEENVTFEDYITQMQEYQNKMFNVLGLDRDEMKKQNFRIITPAAAIKNALKETSSTRTDEANNIEHSELNQKDIKEGEKSDD